MDKDILEARDKAIDALASAIAFWGIDPVEARLYGLLFLSPGPMDIHALARELGADEAEVEKRIKLLRRIGAVKEKVAGERRFEAESDFFQILQTVLRERREREMGTALQEICDQRAYVEYRYEEEPSPELRFLAGRLEKLEGFIHIIDRAMFGLRALAGIRGIFRGR